MSRLCIHAVLFFCLLTAGCASKRLNISGEIDFPVVPVTEPTVFRLQPVPQYTDISYETSVRSGDTEETVEVRARYNTIPFNDELLWHIRAHEMIVGKERFTAGNPLVEWYVTTKTSGEFTPTRFDISFPAFAHAGGSCTHSGHCDHSAQEEEFKQLLKSSIPFLSKESIVSGDTLATTVLNNNANTTYENGPITLHSKLLGYTYRNDRKLVVGEIALPNVLAYNPNDPQKTRIRFDIKGYSLWDAQSMAAVYSEIVMDARLLETGEQIVLKSRIRER